MIPLLISIRSTVNIPLACSPCPTVGLMVPSLHTIKLNKIISTMQSLLQPQPLLLAQHRRNLGHRQQLATLAATTTETTIMATALHRPHRQAVCSGPTIIILSNTTQSKQPTLKTIISSTKAPLPTGKVLCKIPNPRMKTCILYVRVCVCGPAITLLYNLVTCPICILAKILCDFSFPFSSFFSPLYIPRYLSLFLPCVFFFLLLLQFYGLLPASCVSSICARLKKDDHLYFSFSAAEFYFFCWFTVFLKQLSFGA